MKVWSQTPRNGKSRSRPAGVGDARAGGSGRDAQRRSGRRPRQAGGGGQQTRRGSEGAARSCSRTRGGAADSRPHSRNAAAVVVGRSRRDLGRVRATDVALVVAARRATGVLSAWAPTGVRRQATPFVGWRGAGGPSRRAIRVGAARG